MGDTQVNHRRWLLLPLLLLLLLLLLLPMRSVFLSRFVGVLMNSAFGLNQS